ncbi:hypothetical protein [Hymenobacter algoricola]|uniref:hypothetical protein n=1 Tax=Hymenobacter algoricola TaxID=486267 RepID=UPI0031E6A69C
MIRKTRTWLERYGRYLLGALSLLLVSSGMMGQLRGIHSVPGKNGTLNPVWLLYVCGALLGSILLFHRPSRKSKPVKKYPRRLR